MNSIKSELTEVFREVFENPSIELTPETTASDIPNWDSLMNIQLVVAVERKFDIRFSGGEVERLKNVADMINLISSKKKT
jgi:acyl carrier protein